MAMSAQTELLVITFDGEQRAAQAAKVFEGLHREQAVDLHNMAIVARGPSGTTQIHETNDPTTHQGTLFGALIGGLVGLLRHRPVQGAALGATGGYVASKLLDLGFDDTTLRAIADSLAPDTSALVLAIEIRDIETTAKRLAPFGGKVLRDTSPTSQAARLALALGDGVVEGSLVSSDARER